MASQLNVEHSTVGVVNNGDGIINIGRDLVVGSSSEESFDELDLPRESEVFKGREEDIGKLEALLFREGKRKVVIHGLPGFGKTELAVRFAKHCTNSKNIDKAFWINAETSENLKSLHKTLKKIFKIFENKRCLFIFDNGVSRKSIRQYEPPNVENFYLLVTSQIADWNDDIYQMSLKPLKEQASLDVFRAILGDRYQEDEEKIYKEMIKFVSNAPLGLIVISGHLRFNMDAYKQKKFDTNHFFGDIARMLNAKIHYSQSSDYENSIYAAMFVVLEKMYKQDFADSKQTRERSMTLLGICAYLNPDRIYIRDIKDIMECSEENTLDECLYLSKNFSFIEYNDGVIKIHRLCQRILKLYFDEIKKDCYSVCLRWVLRKEYWQWLNGHKFTILMEADNKKETVLKIYQKNVSEKHYPYIEKLLSLLVEYGCCESCELIFHTISLKERKQLVDNMKLIHVAIQENHADLSKLVIKYGNFNVRDSQGKTPLHLASEKGNVDIVRMLLDSGGTSPLHWVFWKGILRMQVKKGAHVHARDSYGKTPLHWASEKGNVDIVRMLLEKGADVHVRDNSGSTPLYLASWSGGIDTVRMLLENGADVHVRNSMGKTPLHQVSLVGNIDIVRMLLEKGADVHGRDKSGSTPLHMVSWSGGVDKVRMLLEKGADVHVRDSYDRTPLQRASMAGNIDIVRMLLEKGADVHVRDKEGKTLLHWAIRGGKVDLVRGFLEKEADVHVQDSEGNAPLHLACFEGNIDIVRMLLEKGADVNVRDNDGRTSLYCAKIFRHTEIINILQQLMH